MPGSVLLVSWLVVLIQLGLVSQLPREPTGILYHDKSTANAVRSLSPPTVVALILVGLVVTATLVWPPLLLGDAIASRTASSASAACRRMAGAVAIATVFDSAGCAVVVEAIIRHDPGRSLIAWAWLAAFALLPAAAGAILLGKAMTSRDIPPP